MKLKALSFRQPWANLVIEGRKTLDLRTWSTHYRGPLAVYASLDVEKEACTLHAVDANTLTCGAVIGMVDLLDIIPLDEATYNAHVTEHLNGRPWREGMVGWVLQNVRPLDPPQVVKGHLKLFDVVINDKHLSGISKPETGLTAPQITVQHPKPLMDVPASGVEASEFELRVIPEADGRYKLVFVQTQIQKNQPTTYRPVGTRARVEVELGSDTLHALADVIIETLRQNGYKATDLGAARRAPFLLNEASGVRLGLIFLAVRPLSKANRIEQISQGVRVMTNEELFYWYSKCTTGAASDRAQKALRVLLSDE